jgi:hypothetical protein
MIKPALHVMFGGSAASSLRQALSDARRKDRIVYFDDDFSFGPINPSDPEARARWVDEHLGVSNWHAVTAETATVMAASHSTATKPVAWISRRDTKFYAGFAEWLWRLGNKPCDIIDITNLTIDVPKRNDRLCHRLAVSPSLLGPGQFIEYGLLDMATPLEEKTREQYLLLWRRLKTENAPLRVLNGLDLVSAPVDFFDPLILSRASTEWQKMLRLLGETLIKSWEGDLHQVGDMVLASRIRALVTSGHLEARGDVFQMRDCELRLRR